MWRVSVVYLIAIININSTWDTDMDWFPRVDPFEQFKVHSSAFLLLIPEFHSVDKMFHRKEYASEVEEAFRKLIFENAVARILEHNLLFDMGQKSYKLAVNQFSDQTHEEVYEKRNGMKPKLGMAHKKTTRLEHVDEQELPDSIDWREQGVITPVMDQGNCGSCYAFAAVSAIEGQMALATNQLVDLSEQNLVDCSQGQGNDGCGGGYPERAYQYIIDNNGIDTDSSYPYGEKEGTCGYNTENTAATIKNYVNITSGDELALKKAVATIGPVSVGIAATDDFIDYAGGIYDSSDCGNTTNDMNHAVTIVGYGTDPETRQDYWIVKNWFGTDWGEDGYIRMSRNKDNQCGIAADATYPVLWWKRFDI